MAHFSAVKKSDDSKEAVSDYLNTVFKLHGLQSEIITDRDSKFTSEFHDELFKRLRVKRKLSTAYHPQTDGLAEVTNKAIIKMLRAFCKDQKDDWDEFLPILEFAFNSAVNSVTGKTPFYLNGGQDPMKPIDLELLAISRRKETSFEEMHQSLAKARLAARSAVALAQEKMKQKLDSKRRDVTFSVGDRVLLSAVNLRLPPTPGSESYKLNEKYVGPFKILERTSEVNYKLDLPGLMQVHPVFHISKLKRYKESPRKFGDRDTGPFSDKVIVDPDEEWIVERILDQGVNDDDKQVVLCHWKGFADSDDTWESADYIKKQFPETMKKWEAEVKQQYSKKDIATLTKRKRTRKKVKIRHMTSAFLPSSAPPRDGTVGRF